MSKEDRIPVLVFCEGQFGKIDGKTANGLARYSSKYEILGIIDSTQEGKEAKDVLNDVTNYILIFKNLDDALDAVSVKPMYIINGVAPDGGKFPFDAKDMFLDAMQRGMGIINTAHDFLSNIPEFVEKSRRNNVELIDLRKPPAKPHFIQGTLVGKNKPIRIFISGTDCAIGKRTTAIELVHALRQEEIQTNFVATGQTGILQEGDYGVVLDAIPGDFMSGEVEHTVVEASCNADVVVIEGQAGIHHPLGNHGVAILMGAQPHGVIIQHAPTREKLDGFPQFEGPNLKKEIKLVELFDSKVIAITLNHEGGTDVDTYIQEYERMYGVPVCDVLVQGAVKLVDAIRKEFSE
jgi:uncharacterized NAD-dependent epimerase/dehydratase family protein